ncbi:MAG: hypothetical protein C0605_11545 [Hyphomicrobiales bacterium]|nr:MAG: hypothetical protein C0605_11545 [Hyphomicrobiales bacterium]
MSLRGAPIRDIRGARARAPVKAGLCRRGKTSHEGRDEIALAGQIQFSPPAGPGCHGGCGPRAARPAGGGAGAGAAGRRAGGGGGAGDVHRRALRMVREMGAGYRR